MACIYFVRHGQTFWNVDNKVCGRTDIDLTPVGYEQAKKTGKTYLLVAHNGIARMVQAYFHDMTNEEFSKSGIKNCELVRFDYK